MTLSVDELQRLVSLSDTKANITALSGTPTEILVAYATDTGEIGVYNGSWHWIGAGASFATPSITLGTANAAGAASTVIRSDATIATFTAAIPLADSGSGSAGTAAKASREDHVHPATAAGQHILLADGHSTPFTFDDLLQMDDGSDFMWSDS